MMESQDFKLGFCENEEIDFRWILRIGNLIEKCSDTELMKDVNLILSDVINIQTGVQSCVDTDMLRSLPDLMDILQQIKKRRKKIYLPAIIKFCCARQNSQIHEKNMILPEDLAILLKCAPPGGSQVPSNVEEKLLEDEFRSKGRSKCGEIGVSVICSFLIQIIHKVIPTSFWGCSNNFYMMKKAIKHVVGIGINDKLYIGDVMRRVKIKSFKWAEPLGSHFLISNVVAKFWIWIIKRLIMGTLKQFFYITSSKSRRNQMLFFRKRSWQKLHNNALGDLIKSGSFEKLSRKCVNKVSEMLKNVPNSKCIPRLRFIPKSEGVRPICAGGRSIIGFSEEELIKAKKLLHYFSGMYESANINVSTARAFEHAWENYIRKMLNSDDEKLYIVKLDIKDAYGSILLGKLMKIIDMCSRKFLDSGLITKFPDLKGCNVNSLVSKLKFLITTQIVHAGQKTRLLIRKGVPQGGRLSAALCNLYYSGFSDQYLKQFIDDKSLLLRSVDDFLFVSASYDSASKYFDFMKSGFPEYNCYINEQKTFHNLTSRCSARITFCGIVLCSLTGQLLVDATALIACPPRYSLSLTSYKQPGKLLARRMVQITLARLENRVINPIFIKECGLFANIWRVGCMSGARFISLIETLKPRGHSNIKHFVFIIMKTSYKVNKRVRHIWGLKGGSLEFPSKFIRAVFVGGICAAFKLKHMPSWPALYIVLKKYIKKLLEDIPEEYQAKLPFCNKL